MRILILHSRYQSGPASGENRVSADEAALLRSAGHEVILRLTDPEVSGPLELVRTGASTVWSRRAAEEVRALVRRHGIDVVHAHNLFPTNSPTVLRAAASEGAAVLLTLHNYRYFCLPANLYRDGQICEACVHHVPWRGVRYRCYRHSLLGSGALAASLVVHRMAHTFDHVTRFIAVSEFVRDKYIEAGFPADRFVVKPNFAFAGPRRRGPGEYFIYLGRLPVEKGVDTLLQAWRLRPGLGRLIVAGDGPEGDRLRRLAPPGVEFTGVISGDQVPGLLAGARALLLPSTWYEPCPRAVMEAYAAGVPLVAARIGGFPEMVVEGVSGFLAPPGDAPAWAETAGRFLDGSEAERMGEGAWQTWRDRYSPERGLANLEAAYRAALTARLDYQ